MYQMPRRLPKFCQIASVHTFSVYCVGMSKNVRQYTVRNVPDQVDSVLRKRAREQGKSFNQVVLDALAQATEARLVFRDLSDVAGTLSPDEAAEIDEEIRRQRQIDPGLWQ